MRASRSALRCSFYSSPLGLEKTPEIFAELPRRRLQAIVAGAVLVTGARSRLQARPGTGPHDDALGRPSRDHHLDVAVGFGRARGDDVFETGDVTVDVETKQAGLREVGLVG